MLLLLRFFFFSSRRRHTRLVGDWSSGRVLFRSAQVGPVAAHAPLFQSDHPFLPIIPAPAQQAPITASRDGLYFGGLSPLPLQPDRLQPPTLFGVFCTLIRLLQFHSFLFVQLKGSVCHALYSATFNCFVYEGLVDNTFGQTQVGQKGSWADLSVQ